MDLDELEIYQESMRIGEAIWGEVVTWDYFDKDTVGKQLVRCADSIASNIAEGHGRYHFAENRNFCRYARGSLQETITFLTKAGNRKLIPLDLVSSLRSELEILRKRLNAYIRSIGPHDP